VLLIDDVMTTGATLYEAARTLQKVRSGRVRGLVLARVLRHGL
jgi:predicted amidophosphoribosyltransferase